MTIPSLALLSEQNIAVHFRSHADNGDAIADFDFVFRAGYPGFPVASDRTHPNPGWQFEILEQFANPFFVCRDGHFMDFQLAPGQVFHGHGTRMLDSTGQFQGGKVFETQESVDAKVPLVVEGTQIAKDGRVDSCDGAPCAHRFRHARGDDIDFVVARDR